jgi:hypothetical protein
MVDGVVHAVGEAHLVESRPDPLAPAAWQPQAAAVQETGGDDLLRGRRDAASRAGALGHVADAAPVDRRAAPAGPEGLTEQADRTLGRHVDADQRPHEGGLAGAVRAEQRDDLAVVDRQVDAAQDVARARTEVQAASLDDGFAHLGHLPSVRHSQTRPSSS